MTPLVLLSAAAVVTLWARVLYLRRLNQDYISMDTLHAVAYRECTHTGWDGPRWRFEAERKELRRQETLRRIAAMRASGQMRRAR